MGKVSHTKTVYASTTNTASGFGQVQSSCSASSEQSAVTERESDSCNTKTET